MPDQGTLQELSENPYPLFRRLQQEEPVSWGERLGLWLVSRRGGGAAGRPQLHRRVRAQPDRGHLPPMLVRDGDEQQRLRLPFSAGYHPLRLQAKMTSFTERTVHRLITGPPGRAPPHGAGVMRRAKAPLALR